MVREPYIYCSCDDAFTWTITFLNYNETTMNLLLTIDDTLLFGTGASMSEVTMLQAPAMLQGSFSIKYPKNTANQQSLSISYDADVTAVKNALLSIGLTARSVDISPATKLLTRAWYITFDAYLGQLRDRPGAG